MPTRRPTDARHRRRAPAASPAPGRSAPERSAAAEPHRPRDAVATRAAILAAARLAFARHGYDHAGVREIAADAGVTGALVNRYFGSKEGLLREVLLEGFRIAALLPEERARLPETLAGYVASPERARARQAAGDPLLLLLRSATNPTAQALIRDHLEQELVAPLAAWLGGEEAELRAALVISVLMGLGVVRRVLRSRRLDGDGERVLADRLAAVFAACVS